MQGSFGRAAPPLGLTGEVRVDAGELASGPCELLGLVIAELVTNAAKHAFCNRVDGIIRVGLIRKADAWLWIVSDNGDGIDVAIPGIGVRVRGRPRIRPLTARAAGDLGS